MVIYPFSSLAIWTSGIKVILKPDPIGSLSGKTTIWQRRQLSCHGRPAGFVLPRSHTSFVWCARGPCHVIRSMRALNRLKAHRAVRDHSSRTVCNEYRVGIISAGVSLRYRRSCWERKTCVRSDPRGVSL